MHIGKVNVSLIRFDNAVFAYTDYLYRSCVYVLPSGCWPGCADESSAHSQAWNAAVDAPICSCMCVSLTSAHLRHLLMSLNIVYCSLYPSSPGTCISARSFRGRSKCMIKRSVHAGDIGCKCLWTVPNSSHLLKLWRRSSFHSIATLRQLRRPLFASTFRGKGWCREMCGTMYGTLDVRIINLQAFRSVADFVWQLGFSSIRFG